jgi:hypothetical protein
MLQQSTNISKVILQGMDMNNQAKVGFFVMVIAIVLIVTIYYVGDEQWGGILRRIGLICDMRGE